jgi:hypothetical protein
VRSNGGSVTVHAEASGLVLDEMAPAQGWRVAERSIGRAAIVVSFTHDASSTVEITVTLTDGKLASAVNSRSVSGPTSTG